MVKAHVVFAAAIIAWCFLITASKESECTDKAVADIVFLVDSSGSIQFHNFQLILDFLRQLVTDFDVARDHVHIGMTQYSSNPKTEFQLNTYQNKQQVLDHINRLQYMRGATYTGKALKFIQKEQFVESAGSRAGKNVPQIAVVITDGRSMDDVKVPADNLKNQKVIIFAIGIKDAVQSQLWEMASPPQDQHEFSVSDFTALKGISQKLGKVLCDTAKDALTLTPALLPITPLPVPHPSPPKDTNECTDKAVADIVFLVDSSGSIEFHNFQLIVDFLRHLVTGFDVARDHVQIGMAQYSNLLKTEFKLKTYQNKQQVLDHINRLHYMTGGTYTGEALKFIQKEQFVESAGSRAGENVPQIAVVITDGKSMDDVKVPADNLKNQKVIIFAIGIKDAVQSQLLEMASPPQDQHVFSVSNFNALQGISQKIGKVLCDTAKEAPTPTPALPSPTPPLLPILLLPPPSLPPPPPLPPATPLPPPPPPPPLSPPKDTNDCIQNEKADIYFLIDHSTSIRYKDFRRVKRFIWEFVSMFHIGPKNVRVGLVKFSNSPKLEFKLSQYTDRKSLDNAVIAVHQTGGDTYIGDALNFMIPLFREAKEDRHKVPRYLIVITDANSHDRVQAPAKKLRQQGVIIYAVGVKGANEGELLSICGDSKRKYFVHNFDAFRPIKDDIVKDICSQAACKNMLADIIFLVDGSGSINAEEFRKMKTFINRLVQRSIQMRPDAVRVGLLQFSGGLREEFSLSRQQSVSGLVQTVNFVQQLGGITLTGRALSLIPLHFDTSKGGRPDVPNILIVLTDGKAQDNVAGPAWALRNNNNIIIYSVGFEDVNITQLREISGSRNRVFIETHFDAFHLMESEILQKICQPDAPVPKKEEKTEKQKCDKKQADLVMLTDSSGSIHPFDFERMKSFMKTLVSSLDIKPDAVRVALAQFSHEPRKEFYLNEVNSEEEAKKRIDTIVQIKSTTNIGMALDFIRNTFFQASSGSRKEKGVSQNLILITDGFSTDKVTEAAEAIRATNVEVFVIGVGSVVHRDELIQIAGSESRVFTVHDFGVLNQIKTTLIQTVCDPSNKQKTTKDAIKELVTQATALFTAGPNNQATHGPTAGPINQANHKPTAGPVHPRPS